MVLNLQGYTGFTYFRKYDRVLSMHWDAIMEGCEYFWICQVSANVKVTQDSEYAWMWLINDRINCSHNGRVLNTPGQSFRGFWMSLMLNRPVLGIWQGCEYAKVTQDAEYAWRSLNMPQCLTVRANLP